MSDAFSYTLQKIQQEGGDPSEGSDAFAQTMGVEAPTQPQQKDVSGIDFNAPVDDVRSQIAKLPEDQRQAALRQWADTYVENERRNGGSGISDTVRNLARGTPVGSFLDEANAGVSAAQYALGLGGAPYEESLAYQRAKDRALDKESTKIGSLPVVGDITVGGATKLAGGILSAPVSPMVNVFRGSAALPQAGNLAATAGIYGGLYGAGQGEGAADRAVNAAGGAAIGGVIGAAGSAVSAGVGNAVQSARNMMIRPSIALRQNGNNYRRADSGAVRRVARAFRDDMTERGSNLQRNYQREAAALGPEGMLADMGPNLRGQAEGIANRPGVGQQTIGRALRSRDRLAQSRLNDMTDRAIGPRQNVPQLVDQRLEASRQAARPLYDQFYQTNIPINRNLRSLMNRAQAIVPNMDREIARLLRGDDVDPNLISNNSVVIDYMKRALDAAISKAEAQGNPNVVRIGTNIVNGLRNEVDNILSPQNPAQSVWARARDAAGEGLQFRSGVAAGRDVFNDGVTADNLRYLQSGRSAAEREGVAVGAREDLRRRMATARSAFDTQSERAASRGRQLLSPSETRAKVAEVAGPQAARSLSRGLDAEGRFAATTNNILGNSATARRLAASQEFPASVDQGQSLAANDLGKKNLTGLGMEYMYRLANFLRAGALDERRLRVAEDAAQLLVQQGRDRDAVASEMIDIINRQNMAGAQRDQIIEWVNRTIRGTIPAAAGQQTQGQ